MKKIVCFLLSLCLLSFSVPAVYAEEQSSYSYDETTKISVTVPEYHSVTGELPDGVILYMDGNAVNEANVERLSSHTFTIGSTDGNNRKIDKVYVNGEDVTDEITGEGYNVPSVYEDLFFTVTLGDEIVPGNLEFNSEIGENAPTLELTPEDIRAIEDAVLTDEDKESVKNGSQIGITLSVTDVGNSITDRERSLVNAFISDKFTPGEYLNIEILKTTDNVETYVTQLSNEIKLTLTIPEYLRAENRTFAMVRLHDGEATLLEDLDDSADTITFSSDKFSVYVLVYADAAVLPGQDSSEPSVDFVGDVSSSTDDSDGANADRNSNNPTDTANTGDTAPMALLVLFLTVSAITLYLFGKKKEN